MKLVPEDTYYITCINRIQMVEDSDFPVFYNNMAWHPFIPMFIGLDHSAISVVALFGDFNVILIGDFSLEDIRDTLTRMDFVEDEYRGVEIWTYDYGGAFAFIDNMIVAGYIDSVEACIRIQKNEEPSWYDNEDMKSIADRLPAGAISMVFGPNYIDDIEILAAGICLRNRHRGDEDLNNKGCFKFDNEASAQDALEQEAKMEHYELEQEFAGLPLPVVRFEYKLDFPLPLVHTHTSSRIIGQFIELIGETELLEIP